VVEVEFTEWTNVGILRHPSYKGQRADVEPREVMREVPAAGMGA
jgi:bifunctional non-homologous end joining protein LigD